VEFETNIKSLYNTYLSLLPMEKADEQRLWKKFRLDWNFNSNRIEGNTLTYGETEALLILGTEPKRIRKDIREMKAHDLAIEHVLSLVNSKRAISENDIRELNKIALKEPYFIETETLDGNITKKEIMPGAYKSAQNHVRLRGGGTHQFADPHEVAPRMQATVKRLKSYLKKQDKPIEAYLAELHQDFIQTHPFDDGNGRVVRLLMNYVCLKLKWPPVIIKDAKKNDYIAALERADDGDISGLKDILQGELTWALKKSIAAAKGQAVDDPDDVDKEIDLYVREQLPIIAGITEKRQLQKDNAQEYFLQTSVMLNTSLAQFSGLFEHYQTNPKFSKLFDDTVIMRNSKNDLKVMKQTFRLSKWIDESRNRDIGLILKHTIDTNILEAKVEVWRENNMPNEHRLLAVFNRNNEDGKFQFKLNLTEEFDKSKAKKISDELSKAILEEIRYFSSET